MTRDTFDLFHQPESGRFGDNETSQPDRDAPSLTRAPGVSPRAAAQSDDRLSFELVLHAETFPGVDDKGAIFVSSNGQEISAQWIPKSLVAFDRSVRHVAGTKKNGQTVQLTAITVHAPEWVAKEKGLV